MKSPNRLNKGIFLFFTLVILLLTQTSKAIEADLNWSSDEQFIQWVDEYIELLKKEATSIGESPVVRITHLVDQNPSNRTLLLIEKLSRAGIDVEGTLVTRSELEKELEALEWSQNHSEDRSKMTDLGMQIGSASGQKKNEKDQYWARVHQTIRQIFGVRSGVTFVEHLFKKKSLGDEGAGENWWKPKYEQSKEFKNLGFNTAGVAMLFYFGAMVIPAGTPDYLFLDGFIKGISSSNIWGGAILYAWVYSCLRWTRELNSFRGQGRTIHFDSDAKPGSQIRVGTNKLFFTGTSLIQELTISALMLSALVGPTHLNEAILIAAGINSVAAMWSYGAVELYRTELQRQSEKALEKWKATGSESEKKIASRLERRSNFIAQIFWNVAFPAMRNVGMVLGAEGNIMAQLPLALFGSVGFAADLYKDRERVRLTTKKLKEKFANIPHQWTSKINGVASKASYQCQQLFLGWVSEFSMMIQSGTRY